jgi:hypothetical protein
VAARHEPPAAYAFDALVELARDATSGGGPASSGDEPDDPAGDAGAAPPAKQPTRATRAGTRRRRGAPVKLLVRIDYDTWLRGAARDGETCELVG